jgi:hypothetical protein
LDRILLAFADFLNLMEDERLDNAHAVMLCSWLERTNALPKGSVGFSFLVDSKVLIARGIILGQSINRFNIIFMWYVRSGRG